MDDDDGPRQSLRVILKSEYNLHLASSGMEALRLLEVHPVDLAIVDIRMPGMSGIETLERIKALDPAVEVIILTAYETLDTATQALRLGACDYLTKPFDLRAIREAVARACERRALWDEMRLAHRRLGELQAQLESYRAREEQVESRGQACASIAHDLNGPLTVISGFVDSIRDQMGPSGPVDGQRLELIRHRIDRVIKQVNCCIDMSRRYLSFLKQNAESETGSRLAVVFSDLEDLLAEHLSHGGHRLLVEPPPPDAMALINPTDLLQILLNLCSNAFQATPQPHTVSVRASWSSPSEPGAFPTAEGPGERLVGMAGLKPGRHLRITVEDDGPGMPPAVLARLFTPFFTTKAGHGGNGLGLSIIQRLVLRAPGAVQVQSAPGRGARFHLFLPATSVP